MICPKCGGKTKIGAVCIKPDSEVFRRRKCIDCGYSMYTAEFEVERSGKFKVDWRKYHRKPGGNDVVKESKK